MNKRRYTGALAVLALVAAACGGGGPSAAPSLNMPSTLGPGEGALDLVIWAGYAEDGSAFPDFNWVGPFETATGCQVNATTQADSANGMQLLRSGNFDGGSFSGNATDRLMAAGDVAPVNTALLKNYGKVFEGLKNKAHNSLNGVPYGVPHGRGPEPPDLEHGRGRRARPHGTASGRTRPTMRASSASSTPRTSSPTRRCT